MSISSKRKATTAFVPDSITSYLMGSLKTTFDHLKSHINEECTFVSNSIAPVTHSKLLLEELFRYMFLLADDSSDGVIRSAPSCVVHQALRCLVLDPVLYFQVCDELLSVQGQETVKMRVLSYDALGGQGDDEAPRKARYLHTLARYKQIFERDPPPAIWGEGVSDVAVANAQPQVQARVLPCVPHHPYVCPPAAQPAVSQHRASPPFAPVISAQAASPAPGSARDSINSGGTNARASDGEFARRLQESVAQEVLEPFLIRTLTMLKSCDHHGVFQTEVRVTILPHCVLIGRVVGNADILHTADGEIAPGYSEKVARPMDMIKMQRKLDAHEYRSLQQFNADVRLMVKNCAKYNGESSPYTQLVFALRRLWVKMLLGWQVNNDASDTGVPSQEAAPSAAPPRTTAPVSQDSQKHDKVEVFPAVDVFPILHAHVATSEYIIPTPDRGRYVTEDNPIELPCIITARRVRNIVGGTSDPFSPTVQRALMTAAWKYLTILDMDSIFSAPVNTADYLNTVVHPMDLGTIKSNIDQCKYSTLAEFDRDLTTMFQNCLHYNEPGVWVATSAEQMQFGWHLCKKNIESVLLDAPELAVQLLPPHI